MMKDSNIDPGDNPEECHCCQFKTTELNLVRSNRNFPTQIEYQWYCHLCFNTMTGTAHQYPEQYTDNGATLKTICYVGNTILAAIKQSRCPHTKTHRVGTSDEWVNICDGCGSAVPEAARDV